MHAFASLSSISQLMGTLAQTPIRQDAKESGEVHLVNGLSEAVNCLCELTSLQTQLLEQNPDGEIQNNGRIIVLTHLRK